MPPTRQFARVTSEYLDRCRASALSSSDASPGWDPTGDPDGDAEFLNDEKIYDGFGDPPRLLTPTAVTDIAVALDPIRLDDLLSELPTSTEEAATARGFGAGFGGDVRAHLTEHFVAVREFCRAAAYHSRCVVTQVDRTPAPRP